MAKGVILAGGTGSRLAPCTQVTNKHLLPVGTCPMVFHPLNLLKKMEITDIMIIVGGESVGDFMKLMGSGENYGLNLSFRVQDQPNGIAGALLLTEDFIDNDDMVVVLGDNIFDPDDFDPFDVLNISFDDLNYYGRPMDPKDFYKAQLFLKEVEKPERFGVATIDSNNEIIKIAEKPKKPETNLAVTGLYMYSQYSDIFEVLKTLKPSNRGELEITDVNNYYVKNNYCKAEILDGFWSDAGTWDSYKKANKWAYENEEKLNL
jgi:glucose-1-phosphate thymidylyltransferase